MVERFTVLGVLFAVVGGKAAQRDRDQVAAPLQIFQQQRGAQLLRGRVKRSSIGAEMRILS